MRQKKIGEYEDEIRLLPTQANNFDHEISVQLDVGHKKEIAINTKRRSSAWKENVMRNSNIVKYTFNVDTIGPHIIKIYVNQTGIIIDQLSIGFLLIKPFMRFLSKSLIKLRIKFTSFFTMKFTIREKLLNISC